MANALQQLNSLGQSIWLDNINRAMIESGKLKELIVQGLLGMTSNPTIFDKAISSSSEYDEKMIELAKEGKSTFEIYDELTIKDVQDATDLFRPVYEKTKRSDGYVSLEINPKLAYNTKETIEEGKRLWKKVNRANLMLKVPSTNEGFEAVQELIALGMNINVTLIFSLEQYINTFKAYRNGIKRFMEGGGDVSKVHSVASVFVSRVDTVVDSMLDEMIAKSGNQQEKEKIESLKGKAAVANSAIIYARYLEFISSSDFKDLQKKGANIQRVLWGSTSTKNPAYNDIKYVTELIGKSTVNTVPDETLSAFLDHGKAKEALTMDVSGSQKIINELKGTGIDVNDVCRQLLENGVIAFEKSFDSLLDHIENKANKLRV